MTESTLATSAIEEAMYEVNMDFSGENKKLAAAALRALVSAKSENLSIEDFNPCRNCYYQTCADIVRADDILDIVRELES